MADTDRVGSLNEEALKRKERLKALKRKLDSPGKPGGHQEEDSSKGDALPKPKFRSYKPENDELKEHILNDATPGDVESHVKDQLDAAKSKVVIEELDITNLAPRKPDWDLKRDVAKKLERLEKRTQRAIAELIRERLKKEAGLDLATSVAVGATTAATLADNDDE